MLSAMLVQAEVIKESEPLGPRDMCSLSFEANL